MKLILGIFLLTAAGGCIEKYNAPVSSPETGYLVVEGFINTGNGPTTIKLSRTTKLDSVFVNPEPFAQVSVEGDDNSAVSLLSEGNGLYTCPQVPINPGHLYRLRIQTGDGNTYLSDYIQPKITPPIDSVSWKADNNQATVFVTTHDPQNNTIYYQWNYVETWKYHSRYESSQEYDNNGGVINRPVADMIYYCWRTDSSSDILLASSAKLGADLIYENPLSHIEYANSDKLFLEYSILVKEHALSKGAYDFLSKMKKNTEQLGSIFDAQPSQLSGNIHCTTDPTLPVIGYIYACSETQKRIFIARGDLPPDAVVFSGYESCQQDTLKFPTTLQFMNATFAGDQYLPIRYWLPPGVPAPLGILYSDAECVDCRVHGGTTQKPDFWP